MTTNVVFVIDTNQKPLQPCSAAVARKLLLRGKAAMFRRYPAVIILKKEVDSVGKPKIELRIDPGSKYTGFALVDSKDNADFIIWGTELEHRGAAICKELTKRSAIRRSRRNRKTRYRKKRFERRKPEGWLAPSLQHRVDTTLTWVKRICKFVPIMSISVEQVKFDLQKLENSDIQGIEYQQGTLAGYTLREALLEHWGRKCAYCDVENVFLEIEHIYPKSKGGSDKFSNLTLACHKCNINKGNKSIDEFLLSDHKRLEQIKLHQKKTLKDAAAVNATRKKLVTTLQEKTFLNVLVSDGASTKMTRLSSSLAKRHWIDAGCVNTTLIVILKTLQPLQVKCNGHGNKQFVTMDAYGFPRKSYEPKKVRKDWKAGDIIRVTKKDGTMLMGRVKKAAKKLVYIPFGGKEASFSSENAKAIHRSDGYRYSFAAIDSELLQKMAT
ncbi:HNH endonuclease [Tolypothrix campylonemoides VB511288]|nr:HNH endonuclease [Tolypothrix campylonemoides VB511288]